MGPRSTAENSPSSWAASASGGEASTSSATCPYWASTRSPSSRRRLAASRRTPVEGRLNSSR